MSNNQMEAGFDLDVAACASISEWRDARYTGKGSMSLSQKRTAVGLGFTCWDVFGSGPGKHIDLYQPGRKNPISGLHRSEILTEFSPSTDEDDAEILAGAAGIEVDGRTPLDIAREAVALTATK